MFTETDLEALVPDKIFKRGVAYYEDAAVGSIRQEGSTFIAKVRGGKTYRVSLEIRSIGPPEIQCDCPYDYGDVCKHGIALGLAVLGLLGDAAVVVEPAPLAKLSQADQSSRILSGAWARTSDKEKLAFLRQLLALEPKQLRRFLAAFEFDVNALAGLPAPARLIVKPIPLPVRRPAPRRPLTLTEQAQQLLNQKRGTDLLPLLLSVDWLQNPPAHDTHTLPHLLSEAARFQPEATFDAVMERFEAFLEDKALRAYSLYNRLAACLEALALLPPLTKQVQLFASELMQKYRRLKMLQEIMGRVGFAVIAPEEATDLPPKPRKRQPKKAA